MAPRSGGKDLRVRGLAVGSSQLPWAHIKDAIRLVPVKGQVSLGSDTVCSRTARNPFTPHILRPDTVAPSAAPKLVAGGEDGPASSIGGPPTVEKNAKPKTGSTGLVAPNAGGQRQHRPASRRRRTRRPSVRRSRARASAQQRNPDFFAAIVPGAKCISHDLTPILAGGFVALPAARRCAELSSGNGDGDSEPVCLGADRLQTLLGGPELRGKSFHGSHGS
jgi:hypothetical protein